ncbi:MAG TPA: hypothetical protein VEK73_02295 [Xanthobacteraceae bacterium]|nr:hypothetical protein [Xanthobacteraceae bacterium]
MSAASSAETAPQARLRELRTTLHRLLRAAAIGMFRLVPGDDERLLSHLLWLQQYSTDTHAALEREPLFVLSALDSWMRRVRSLRLSTIQTTVEQALPRPAYLAARVLARLLYPLYWIMAAVGRAVGIGAGAAAEFEQTALKWIPAWLKPIPRKIRWLLFLPLVEARRLKTAAAARAMSGARLDTLYPYARKCAYDLLVHNGDLAAAAQAFEFLSQIHNAASLKERAFDQFTLGMLATLARLEREIAVTNFGGRPVRLIIALTLLDAADVDLFETFAAPSLLSPGNVPALPRTANPVLHVIAGAECRARLVESPAFARLRELCRVRIDEVSPDLVRAAAGERRGWLEAALLQQSCGLAARLGATLALIEPGSVYSENYLPRLRELPTETYSDVVLSMSFPADRAGIGPALAAMRGADGSVAVGTRALHTLGLRHLHPTGRRLLVTADEMRHGRIPRTGTFMWCEDDSIILHAVHHRPLSLRGTSLSEAAALCYYAVDSPLVRNWVAAAQVTVSAHAVLPGDDIGFIDVAAPDAADVPTCSAREFGRMFWHGHSRDGLELLRRELRLPVEEVPSGIPWALPSDVRSAFVAVIDQIRRSPMPDETLSGITEPMSVTQLVSYADAIYRFEVNSGYGTQVENKIEELRALIRVGQTSYDEAVDRDNLDALAVCLLRLGLLHELIELKARHALTLDPTVSTFVNFCSREFQEFAAQGQTWRTLHPDENLFVVSGVVWGEQYVANFMDYCLRSLLAPGNLPAIARQGPCVVVITTDEAGAAAIRRHPAFAAACRHAAFRFALVPDAMIKKLVDGHLKRMFYLLYGMLDHIGVFFAQGAKAHLFMIPVDAIVADGSLVAMANYRHDGFECCGGGNLVAETETFLPELAHRYAGEGAIAISTFDLASLAIAHPHHYFVSQVICRENTDFGMHARELFWPVAGGMEIHSCFIHPLFTAAAALQRYRSKHFANVDYGMLPRMFSEPDRIKIIEDTKEAYINNFASRTRRYETTGAPFAYDAFLTAHQFTYPVQKALFIHAQTLPCRYEGITPYRDTAKDVAALVRRLRPAKFKRSRPGPAQVEPAGERVEAVEAR